MNNVHPLFKTALAPITPRMPAKGMRPFAVRFTIGAEVHLPFGGVKHTGNGHREGLGALDFFTTWKAVYVDYSDKLQRAQIDNAE